MEGEVHGFGRLQPALLAAVLSLGSPAADPLETKARAFREALLERHLSREGLVLYRIDLRTIEADLERGTYPDLADGPTFTGLLAAGACGRASFESGEARAEALADADRALSGLELLMAVTGRRGLLARSVRRAPPPDGAPPRKKWLNGAPGYEDFSFRANVSMDQYANGLLPAVGLCAEHFPERTRALIVAAAEHLLRNRMRLVDPDGEQTRFGDLSPGSGFGFNSLAKLTGYGVFALSAALDPDPRWAEQRDRLRDESRVVARAKRTNLRVLGITNHSNDLMAWNLYRVLVPLARRTGDSALADLRGGMERTWRRVRDDGNAYFALVHCSLEPEACSEERLAEVRALLDAFPLEKRKLAPPDELARVPKRLLPGRKWVRLARNPVPIELRPVSSFEWKSSPYRLRRSVAPDVEYTGLDFLVAYWLYREVTGLGAPQ
ncbi:MAG: hypothetical protein V3V67_05515 [Myxococcota bacterium]